jgi:hypothetical protein
MPELGPRLILYAFLAVGLALSGWYMRERRRARKAELWPTASAEILSSDIVGTRNRKGGETFSPRVTYRYDVAGITHESDRVQFGGDVSMSNIGWAQGIVERFPKGARVEAYYDPDNPAFAVLDPQGRAGLLIIGVAGLMFMAIPAIVLFALA